MLATIVETIAFHHAPAGHDLRAFSPLTVVHAANVLEHELSPAKTGFQPAALDTAYLARLGLDHRIETWRAEALRLRLPRDESA